MFVVLNKSVREVFVVVEETHTQTHTEREREEGENVLNILKKFIIIKVTHDFIETKIVEIQSLPRIIQNLAKTKLIKWY